MPNCGGRSLTNAIADRVGDDLVTPLRISYSDRASAADAAESKEAMRS
jgi:hypothetical protein